VWNRLSEAIATVTALKGSVKRVTGKRDKVGDFYIAVLADIESKDHEPKSGVAAGFDFGLKTMLTVSNAEKLESPYFYRQASNAIACARGAGNRERKQLELARVHRKVARHREEHHWKLARLIVRQYDWCFFENLNLKGMVRMWCRKINDIAFGALLSKTKYMANKCGKNVGQIGRFEPTTVRCHVCGEHTDIELKDRNWTCPSCKSYHDRDINVAIMICKVGASPLS